MNSKMKIFLTLIIVTTLALGVVSTVSAEDLGINSNLTTIDNISYNANSNEIKNVENEINVNNGYSSNGISEKNLTQENSSFIFNDAVTPVLNSENDRTQDLQFINGNTSLALINSINMVDNTIKNGTIYSTENKLLTQINIDNTNTGMIFKENMTMTPILENDYVGEDIIKSIEGTSIALENNINSNAVYADELEYNKRNYIENINYLENNNVAVINATMNSTTKLNIKDLIYSGDSITGNVTVMGNNTGLDCLINLTVNNKRYNVSVINGTGIINIPISLAVGIYNVTAIYPGNDEFKPSKDTTQITVKTKEVNIHIETQNITYGDKEVITIKLTEKINGTVYVTLNSNYPDQVAIINGVGTITKTNLNAGIYNVEVEYSTDDYGISNTTRFTVERANTEIEIYLNDMKHGENLTGEIFLSGNGQPINGMITITIDSIDRNYNLNVVDGVAHVNLDIYYQEYNPLKVTNDNDNSYLPVGEHVATIKYAGDRNFNSAIENETFMVEKTQAQMSIDITQTKNNVTITIHLPKNVNTIIDVFVNNEYYSVEVIDGVGILTLVSLSPNTYEVLAVFDGDNNYWGNEANTQFIVSKENDHNSTDSSDTMNAQESSLLLDASSSKTGNPIALLLLALMLPMVRRVIKK